MRRILLMVIATLLATSILVACGAANKDNQSEEQKNTNEPTDIDETEEPDANDNTNTKANKDQTEMQQKMDELGYKEFELEVEYANNIEYEAKIDYDDNQLTADLEDELTNVDLEGQEAFDEIYSKVQLITIDPGTAKEDAIEQVLVAFDLGTDYNKFELEITFKDDTKIEFKDRK